MKKITKLLFILLAISMFLIIGAQTAKADYSDILIKNSHADSVAPGKEIETVFSLEKGDNILSFQLELKYDASKYTFVSLSKLDGLYAKPLVNTNEEGKINIVYSNTKTLTPSTELFSITMVVKEDAQQGDDDFLVMNYQAENIFSTFVDGVQREVKEFTASLSFLNIGLYGDVDGDGTTAINDVTSILLHIAGLKELSESQLAVADINKDGKVNISDATRIQLYLAKMIDSLKPATQYTVNFYGLNNVLLDSQKVGEGKAANAPIAPDVEGYEFLYWSQSFDAVYNNLDVFAIYSKKADSIKTIYQFADNTFVKVIGEVTFIDANGFYIKDETGSVYVEMKDSGVILGNVVEVLGTAIMSGSLPKIVGDECYVNGLNTFIYSANQVSVTDINSYIRDYSIYGSMIHTEFRLSIKDGKYYANNGKSVEIVADEATKEILDGYKGKLISVYAVLFDYEGSWRIAIYTEQIVELFDLDDAIEQATNELIIEHEFLDRNNYDKYQLLVIDSAFNSALSNLANSKNQADIDAYLQQYRNALVNLEKVVEVIKNGSLAAIAGKETSTDITLPARDQESGILLSYKSNNPAIIDDAGKIVSHPTEAIEVEFTLYATYNGKQDLSECFIDIEYAFTVTILQKTEASLAANQFAKDYKLEEQVYFPYGQVGRESGNSLPLPLEYTYNGVTYNVEYQITDEHFVVVDGIPTLVTQYFRYTESRVNAVFSANGESAVLSILLNVGASNELNAAYLGWRSSEQQDESLSPSGGLYDVLPSLSYFDKAVGNLKPTHSDNQSVSTWSGYMLTVTDNNGQVWQDFVSQAMVVYIIKDANGNIYYDNTEYAGSYGGQTNWGKFFVNLTGEDVKVAVGTYATGEDVNGELVAAYGNRNTNTYDGYGIGFVADKDGKVILGSERAKLQNYMQCSSVLVTMDENGNEVVIGSWPALGYFSKAASVGSGDVYKGEVDTTVEGFRVPGIAEDGTYVAPYVTIPANGYGMSWKYQFYGVGNPESRYPFTAKGAQISIERFELHPNNEYNAIKANELIAGMLDGSIELNESNVLKARVYYNKLTTDEQRAFAGDIEALEKALAEKPEIYYVNFYGKDGEFLGTVNVEKNCEAYAPEPPYYEGFVFVCWNKDITNVTSNMDVYAIYEKEVVSIDPRVSNINKIVSEHRQNDGINYQVIALPAYSGNAWSSIGELGTVETHLEYAGLGKRAVVVGDKVFLLGQDSLVNLDAAILGTADLSVYNDASKQALRPFKDSSGQYLFTTNSNGLKLTDEGVISSNSYGYGVLYYNAGTETLKLNAKALMGRVLDGTNYGYQKVGFSYDALKGAYVAKVYTHTTDGADTVIELAAGDYLWAPMSDARFGYGLAYGGSVNLGCTDPDGNKIKGCLYDGAEVQIWDMGDCFKRTIDDFANEMVDLFNSVSFENPDSKLTTKDNFLGTTHPNIKYVFSDAENLSKYKWFLEYVLNEINQITDIISSENQLGLSDMQEMLPRMIAGDTTAISGAYAYGRTALRQFIHRLINVGNPNATAGNTYFNDCTIDFENNPDKVAEFLELYSNNSTTTTTYYTVEFIGLYGEILGRVKVAEGQAATAPGAPVCFGYRFIGWDNNYSEVYSDLVIKAIYEKIPTYVVTFRDMYGNVLSTIIVEEGSAVFGQEAPEVEGHKFVGWDSDISYITSDMDVYPIYDQIKMYKVSYNLNGGKIGYASIDALKAELLADYNAFAGKEYTLENFPTGSWSPINFHVFLYENYEKYSFVVDFLAKYSKSDNAKGAFNLITSGPAAVEAYHDGQYFVSYEFRAFLLNIVIRPGTDFESSDYTNLYANLDLCTDKDSEELVEGTLLPTPIKQGYLFIGWYLDEELTIAAPTTVNGDLVLYAKWADASDNSLLVDKFAEEMVNLFNTKGHEGNSYYETTRDNFQGSTHPNIKYVFDDAETLAKYKWFLSYVLEELNQMQVSISDANGYAGWTEMIEMLSKMIEGDTTAISSSYANGRTAFRQFIHRLINYNNPNATIGNTAYNGCTIDYANNPDKLTKFATLYAIAAGLQDATYYTVQFYGLNDVLVQEIKVVEGQAAFAPTMHDEFGYRFVGWDTDFSKVESDLIVKAIYEEIPVYTVIFMDNFGNLIDEQSVEQGRAAKEPTAPVVEGYIFTGWDIDFSNVTSDLVVTGTYEEASSHVVTYVTNGGILGYLNIDELKAELVKDYNEFSGNMYTLETFPTGSWSQIDLHKFLYANYGKYSFLVDFLAEHAKADSAKTALGLISEGPEAVESVRDGQYYVSYEFRGFLLNKVFRPGSDYETTDYTSLYETLDCQFDEVEVVYYGSAFRTPRKENLIFLGWYLDEALTIKAPKTVESDVTVYAKWGEVSEDDKELIEAFAEEMVNLFNTKGHEGDGYVETTKENFQGSTHPNVKYVFDDAETLAQYAWLFEYVLADLNANTDYDYEDTRAQVTEMLTRMIAGDTTAISGSYANGRSCFRQFIHEMINANDPTANPGNSAYNPHSSDYSIIENYVKLVEALKNR